MVLYQKMKNYAIVLRYLIFNMADQKPKVENPVEQQEALPKAKTPVDVKIDRRAVQSESHLEVRGLASEIAKKGQELPQDQQTLAILQNFHLETPAASPEQQNVLRHLELVCLTGLLSKMATESLDPKKFSALLPDLSNFKNLPFNPQTLAAFSPLQQKGFNILKTLSENTKSSVTEAFSKQWQRITAALPQITGIALAAKGLDLSASTKAPPNLPPKELGMWEKTKNFVVEHPIITGLSVIGGGLLIKHFFFSSNEEKKPEEKGFFDKMWDKAKDQIKLPVMLTVLGLCASSALMNRQEIMKWISKNIPSFNMESGLKFWQLFQNGEYLKAFSSLWEGTGKKEDHSTFDKIGEKIKQELGKNVSKKTLEEMKNEKFASFISGKSLGEIGGSTWDKFKKFATSTIGAIPELSSQTAEASKAVDAVLHSSLPPEKLQELETLRKFLQQHQAELNGKLNADSTILDALKIIEKSEKSETRKAAPNPTDQKTSEKDAEKTPQIQPTDFLPALITATQKVETGEKKNLAEKVKKDLDERYIPAEEITNIVKIAEAHGVSTVKLAELMKAREEKQNAYLDDLQKNAKKEKLAKKAEDLMNANEELGNELRELKKNTQQKTGWKEEQYLAVTQAPMFVTRYLRLPSTYREYGKYLLGELTVGATESATRNAQELFHEIFQKEKTATQLATEVKKLETKFTNSERMKAQYLDPTGKPLQLSSAQVVQHDFDFARIAEVENELILTKNALLIQQKREALAILKQNNPLAPAALKLEQEIQEELTKMETLKSKFLSSKNQRVQKELARELSTDLSSLRSQVERPGQPPSLLKEHYQKFDQLSSQVENMRKELEAHIANRVMSAEQLPRGSKEQAAVVREINDLFHERVNLDIKGFDEMDGVAKKFRTDWDNFRSLHNGALNAESEKYLQSETAKLRTWFNRMIGGATENANQLKTAGGALKAPGINSFKGNVVFYTVMIGAGTYFNQQSNPQVGVEKSLQQAAIDIMPVTGTASDFYSAIKGKEYITEKELDATDRTIRGAFGVAGLLCDIGTVAGIGLAGRAALSSAKGARAAKKAIGLREVIDVALKSNKEIDTMRGLREIQKTGRFAQGLLIAGSLGAAGYNYILKPTETRTISPEMKAIMGDQLKETAIAPPTLK